jgi:predicted enzyme related to lactoylglutathione lyase
LAALLGALTAVDLKFEIVVIPVSDFERAKKFYARLGWRLDADFDSRKERRTVPSCRRTTKACRCTGPRQPEPTA